MGPRAILLPGGVMPADIAYGALIDALGDDVEAIAKDLEVYAGPEPPPDYTLEHEIGGLLRTAQDAGFDRFHLVGYSGGGASSLAFAAVHGERLLSLALLEPAWAGNERTPVEEAVMQRFRALEPLPPDRFMRDSCDCNSRRASSRRRLPRARHHRGWPSDPRVCVPSSTRSTEAT